MESRAKYNIPSLLIWSFTAFLFVAFIAWLCYLYPLGADEYSLYPRHALDIIQGFFLACLTNSPRIGIIPARIVLFISDYAFAVINPLVQLALALLSFYAVFLRLPNFKTLKDYPAFLLILILNTFAVAQPDNNIFWIGGASAAVPAVCHNNKNISAGRKRFSPLFK